ncbi:MAG: hypothetical protein KI786_20140 [Mameliella sp.]|nr:hypothetical protein [Phaeodactylibacter sp.]
MAEQKNTWLSPFRILLIAVGIILLLRFAGPLRFMILTLTIIGGIGFLGYLVYEYIRQQNAGFGGQNAVPLGVGSRMEQVEEQLNRNEKEIKSIRQNLRELRKEVHDEDALNAKNLTDAQYLIREFEAELELRRAKSSFYKTVKHKLNRLLHNHQLSQSLADKEAELRRLKEHHYDDLADMEAMRSDMELETLYLDTIDELSLKVPDNLSLEHVQELQKQLEEMTRGLER